MPRHGATITHQTTGIYGSGRVFLKPASPGTGVIAGGGVRAVLELGGIRDVLAKSLGTTNPINMLKAAEQALRQLRRPEEVAKARGKQISEVLPYKAPVVAEDHDVSDPGITLAVETPEATASDSTDQASEPELAETNQTPAVPAPAEEVTATDAEGEADASS